MAVVPVDGYVVAAARSYLMATTDIVDWTRRNWFVPLFPIVLAVELAFVRATEWSTPGMAEAAVVFDLCVAIPALHALCYFRSLPPRALLVRTAALAFLGVYIASRLVPSEAQVIISDLLWAKSVGWAVLALFELFLAVQIVKLVFGGKLSASEISKESGAPEWVARLMVLEARFWKAVWKLVRRR